jgi:hypothetical protein
MKHELGIEMGEHFFGVYACIGSSGSGGFYFFSQNSRESFFQLFLHRVLIRLYLITKVRQTVVTKFNKIPHGQLFLQDKRIKNFKT